ncbi:uncharacterized protein NPIL_60251 [Nephila pilipes]|uniref:Uncharacterized protein n=1 Tax=Nephila pilipes TaxID=299642 RepID=A0A8X6TT50_NEPPI|nr:uncharacterized protein NPIL_60251 [Nephila pilipes]
MDHVDVNQNFTNNNGSLNKDVSSILSQHEALRRATLLKHRKVSTQLKLDMVQRQLSGLRRSVTDSDSARQFYRKQMAELSNELQDLDCNLDKVERSAFYARKRLLRQCGMDFVSSSTGAIPLSSSHSAIFSSSEHLSRSNSRSSLKSKVCHLMSSPGNRFRKRHLLGELRAVASLSSLNTKSGSPTHCEDEKEGSPKDTKSWKAPLKFLGNFVDSRIRRRLWGSSTRTKSADNILEEKKDNSRHSDSENKDCNGFETTEEGYSSSDSSSESDVDDEVEEIEQWKPKSASKCTWKAPVARKISNHQKAQIDPAILAEIEDFERMAAQYIKQHT